MNIQKRLKRVVIWNEENKQVIALITNQMYETAHPISELYKSRWQIEIFFRAIRQVLHIKSFIGTTKNAVMAQIWPALITTRVLKALKAMAKFKTAFIRGNLFVKINLQQWVDQPFGECTVTPQNQSYQGIIF
jgi:IS4 transposase